MLFWEAIQLPKFFPSEVFWNYDSCQGMLSIGSSFNVGSFLQWTLFYPQTSRNTAYIFIPPFLWWSRTQSRRCLHCSSSLRAEETDPVLCTHFYSRAKIHWDQQGQSSHRSRPFPDRNTCHTRKQNKRQFVVYNGSRLHSKMGTPFILFPTPLGSGRGEQGQGPYDLGLYWKKVYAAENVKAVDKFKILGVLFEIIFGGCYCDIFGGAIQKINSYFYWLVLKFWGCFSRPWMFTWDGL